MLGEIHCLNCGRHLADIVRDEAGRARLGRPAGQLVRAILVSAQRGALRCKVCGGRALVERPIGLDIRPAVSTEAA